MKWKNRLLTALATLITLAVAAAGLWAPRALFAAQDSALYTTHPTARTGGSLAVRPEDLQLVRALRTIEDMNLNGGYWNYYDNTWEAPEELLWRMYEISAPLRGIGMMSEQGADRFLEYALECIGGGESNTSHNVSSQGFENLSLYCWMPDRYVEMALSVEMSTGLLTYIELRGPDEVLDEGMDMETVLRAYVDYLGLSVFADWTLLTTGDWQNESYIGFGQKGCLLYSGEAQLAINAWYYDYRMLGGPDSTGSGSLGLSVWIESYALNPTRPQQWRDEWAALLALEEVIEAPSTA